MLGEIQPLLFKTGPLSDSRLVAKTKLEIFGRNLDDAFGVTQTKLNKGSYGVLENIFYGMNNLEISLEILSIENPAEILSEYFAAGSLKRGDAHRNPNANVPRDFLRLVNYINRNSYSNIGFANLTHKFKKCFDSSPGKQMERLEILEPSVKEGFVNSFRAKYRPSNKEDSVNQAFYDPNYDGGSKGTYANLIYSKLKSLSERVKEIVRIIL